MATGNPARGDATDQPHRELSDIMATPFPSLIGVTGTVPGQGGAPILLVAPDTDGGMAPPLSVTMLRECGVLCVVATGFTAAFQADCQTEGILAVTVPAAAWPSLLASCAAGQRVTVDMTRSLLVDQAGTTHPFTR